MPSALVVESEEELAEIVRSMRTVAVVGIKDGADPDAPAYAIPKLLHDRGVRIVPINPKFESIFGERALPGVASLPDRPDVLDVFRRADAIGPLADEVLALPPERRPPVFWMQTGIRNEAAAERLAAAGIRVVMDRCLGVYTARYRPHAES